MQCPYCGGDESQVKDSRPGDDGAIRRRRECSACHGRFTTFERVQTRELWAVKRNGTRQPFDREKITRAIVTATRKRPVSREQVDRVIGGIVRDLEKSGQNEIATEAIGSHVLEALRGLDHVAYIRFASVYREFADAADFDSVLRDLKASPEA